MAFSRVLLLASAFLAVTLAQAAAQFPPPPGQGQQASPFPPPGQQASPFPPVSGGGGSFVPPGPQARGAPGAAPGGKHPCEAFIPLRQAAESGAAAIRAAGERKATPQEVCPLFKRFAVAEEKILKFMQTNKVMCGVPDQAIKQLQTGHANTVRIRNQVCNGGPAGGAPPGPSLSDALGAPLVPNEPPAPGRGTFDTLTGNVLAR